MTIEMAKTAIIAGVGPGFCEQLAWKLARENYAIGLFARSSDYLNEFASNLKAEGHDAIAVPTDLTDKEQIADAIDSVRNEFGQIQVLAYTASAPTSSDVKLDPDRFTSAWQLYTQGALLSIREVLPDMREDGGTILFYGAAPDMGDFAYQSAKDGARGLARTLADRYGPEGIHIAHVELSSPILNPDVYEEEDEVNEEEYVSPEAAVNASWHLIAQDESGWTFDLALRPGTQTLA